MHLHINHAGRVCCVTAKTVRAKINDPTPILLLFAPVSILSLFIQLKLSIKGSRTLASNDCLQLMSSQWLSKTFCCHGDPGRTSHQTLHPRLCCMWCALCNPERHFKINAFSLTRPGSICCATIKSVQVNRNVPTPIRSLFASVSINALCIQLKLRLQLLLLSCPLLETGSQ